ncbi:hypothetical protein GDO81_016794 [Engystomops pustulosus]|uniref:Uncharacterized protein n=1 Tax=Engystomops pustulosus TaxID=76066 RepID=A0AAV7AIR1_ENGPU|nr:hypothetical protein GDO81_016794 [Engystomops pustulosus]
MSLVYHDGFFGARFPLKSEKAEPSNMTLITCSKLQVSAGEGVTVIDEKMRWGMEAKDTQRCMRSADRRTHKIINVNNKILAPLKQ